MLDSIMRGLGLVMDDPLPGPGVAAGLSGTSYVDLGNVQLVPELGRERWATYREIYLTNPWVWSAVNKLASGMGRLPLGVFELDANGDRERVRSDLPQAGPLTPGQELDALLHRPQGRVSVNNTIGGTVRDRLIYGNALWTLERGRGGRPTAVQRRAWRNVVKVKTDDDDAPLWYELRRRPGSFEGRRFLPTDVVHFGLGSDEGALGVSPLASCSHTLALHNAVMRHLLGYFGNSAQTQGHIQVEKLTADKAREIRQMIAEVYSGPENAGKILVTSGKWEGTSDSPDAARVVELISLSREEVAAAYAIPPPVLGILDRAIKSNVKELREQYVRDGLGPQAADFEGELLAQLIQPVPSWHGYFSRFNLAAQLQPDLEARALVYQRAATWLTTDDIRRLEDMKPIGIKGVTDVPWSISGTQPMSQWAEGNNPTRPRQAGGQPSRGAGVDALSALELELARSTNGHHAPEEDA